MAPPKERFNRKAEPLSLNNQLSIFAAFFVGILGVLIYYNGKSHTLPIDERQQFVHWFLANGGWIAPNLTLQGLTEYGNGIITLGEVTHQQKLLEVPLQIIITQQSSKKKLSELTPQHYTQVVHSIQSNLVSPLDQQDAWIAIELMLECSKGRRSQFYPYLAVLPSRVTILQHFSPLELNLIQDEDLASFARSKRSAFDAVWRSALHPALASGNSDTHGCFTLDSFNRFVGLSLSRAMILQEQTKYLTPMADMINHADLQNGSSLSNFSFYHRLDGMISVFADRHFTSGSAIVEEYGKNDNSLYIAAFGFVPKNNPYHCALMQIPTDADPAKSICVHRNGRLLEGETGEQALAYDVMRSLHLCKEKAECWQHPDRQDKVRDYLQQSARRKLESSATTLEDDMALLKELLRTVSNNEHSADFPKWREMNRDHARLALEFRIEEKKLLKNISRTI
jgi:hypothetical protein